MKDSQRKAVGITALNASSNQPATVKRGEIRKIVDQVNRYARAHPDPCNPFKRTRK